MMFDYNPWTSLFLLQAIRMCNPRGAHRRAAIATAQEQPADATDVAVSRVEMELASAQPRVKLVKCRASRGWRHAFRTHPDGAEAVSAAQREDIAA